MFRYKFFFRIVILLSLIPCFLNAQSPPATKTVAPYKEEGKFNFRKEKILVGKNEISVEIADTPELGARGLMFREKLAANEGMLFEFPDERPLAFWMKNTFIDLDIGYFDKNQKLIEVLAMKATSKAQLDHPSYPSQKPAKYALEMNVGWFAKNKVKEGDTFKFLSRGFKSRDR